MVPHISKALRARLTRFECHDALEAALPVWKLLPDVRSFTANWPDPVELVRDGKTVVARVHVRSFNDGDGEELECLPKTVKTVEVIGNATLARRIAKAQPRFDVIVRPPPSGRITGVKD